MRGADNPMGWRMRFQLTAAIFCVLLLASACARTGAPPESSATVARGEAAQQPQPASSPPTFATLQEQAELHFEAGQRAYSEGNYRYADEQFQAALSVYLEAEVPAEIQPQLQEAFNELFTRIHALGLEGLMPTLDEEVLLPDEELPTPPEEELEALRARLLDPLPERPRFSMPVPDPRDNARVEAALVYLTTERKEVVEEGLSRATRYMPMILATLEEVGVPRELAWVPLIESLFKPYAYSRARAMGMWQFMSGTARLYGMRVDWAVDERKDPVRATRTAAIYLKDLYEEMGSWELALASYNGGKGRVQRAIERHGTRDFWRIAETRYLARETRDFVPKIFAAIHIGTDPERFGLTVVPQEPFEYDEAIVDSVTDLRVLADAAGTTMAEIQELNPHLRSTTPPNVDEYVVRVPKGSKQSFETALAAIPPGDRVHFLEHRISSGETISEIAARYGASQSSIMEMNNIRNARRLQIGQRLVIPVGEPGRYYTGQPLSGYDQGEQITYRVQRGDTLVQIARLHRTTIANLMRWNSLSSDLIYPGDRLVVYYGITGTRPVPATATSTTPSASRARSTSSPSSSPRSAAPGARSDTRSVYTVRRGDNFYDIAQKLDVTVDELKSWNNRRSDLLHPGDKLVVYSDSPVFVDQNGVVAAHTVVNYTVRRGDSPYEIARRFGVSLDRLLDANNLSSRSTIYPGDVLVIPGAVATAETVIYTVRRGDTPAAIAQRHGVSLDDLLRANGLTRRSIIYPGDRLNIPRR